jgi:hypothetical protein
MPLGSLVSGFIGAGGAAEAGNAAGNAGWTTFQNGLNAAGSAKAIESPYLMGGYAGTNALLQALGIGQLGGINEDGGVNSTAYGQTSLDKSVSPSEAGANGLANFRASPGYQFRLGEGINALDRSASAKGMNLSGEQARAISDYGQNTASSEWNNYINQLAGLAGIGQNAAASTNNAATSAYNNGNDSLMKGLMGQAADYSNSANALASGIGNAINSLGSLATFGLGGGFGGIGGGQVGGYTLASAPPGGYGGYPGYAQTLPGFGGQ